MSEPDKAAESLSGTGVDRKPEFSLPTPPKTLGEFREASRVKMLRLQAKAEEAKSKGVETTIEQFKRQVDTERRIGEHLTDIGREYVNENMFQIFPDLDVTSDDKDWTEEQIQTRDWALDNAHRMPIAVVRQKAKERRQKLERGYRIENLKKHDDRTLQPEQRSELQALDQLNRSL